MPHCEIGDTVVLQAAADLAGSPEIGVVIAREDGMARVSWPARTDMIEVGALAAVTVPRDPARQFRLGDRVVRNPVSWIANAFDGRGRGEGIGIVVPSPFPASAGEYDVVWPGGRCFEDETQLLPAP